jgi:hypothetical protein
MSVASLNQARKAREYAQGRAAEATGEKLRSSEAANVRRFGEGVRDLRAFGQVTDHGVVTTTADGSPALLIKFRDPATAQAAGDAIYGAWGE